MYLFAESHNNKDSNIVGSILRSLISGSYHTMRFRGLGFMGGYIGLVACILGLHIGIMQKKMETTI